MRKKLVAGFLVFSILLSFIPIAAFAEDWDEIPVAEDWDEISIVEDWPETPEDSGLINVIPEPDPIAEPETSDGEAPEGAITDYAEFLSLLRQLETVAEEYGQANDKSGYGLVLNYIRTGAEKYQDSLWAGVAGAMDTAFIDYVADQDEANGTNISALRVLGDITVPNGDSIEMVHLVAVMDIANYQSRNDPSVAQPYKDFGGWLGDLGDLLYQVMRGNVDCVTDFEAGVAEIKTNYLGVNLGRNSFDMQDIRGDLDAVYLMARHDETGEPLSAMFEEYYTETHNDTARAAFYMSNRYPEISAIAPLRSQVYKDYMSNLMCYALEGKRDIDRNAHPEWVKGVCYAWADYMCEMTGISEFGEYPPDDTPTPTPTPTPDPDPVDLDNDYYKVFSSTTTTLVPGVTQTIKLANTADEKQMAYYIATADINRPDITLCAGYKDYNGNVWGMQSVTDQIAAAQAAHADEIFNVIVGTNADFFNMSTGEPSGLLVMNGVQYHGVGNEAFFAILKDGSAFIGAKSDYAAYADQIEEAVGANTFLVRNGEISVGKNTNYMNSRASRTCVGITESGKVVLMVLDGRQEPWSCGGSAEEIAQIMLDAGCVTAVNLDGGGSSTFAAKPEGADTVQVINRPSDGFERRVSSSLMIVSSSAVSNELDHANLSSENIYLMPGAEMQINAVGVSESGNSAPLPEELTWVLSDEIGYMESDVFHAEDYGDLTITLMDGEKELGSIELHIVLPDEMAFDPQEFDAIYDSSVEIPLTASYMNNVVAIPSDPEWAEAMFYFELEKEAAGWCEGLTFYAASADCGARSTKIVAGLYENDVTTEGTIRLFSADEASFDFNNCTGGDRILAWNRTVTNTTTSDNIVYYQDNPEEGIIVEYAFALDMNDLQIPENIAQALPLVAAFMGEGQIDGSTTAWELMLMLAERISPSTIVTVTVNVDPRLEMDLSEMIVNCQFFELTDVIYDEEESKIQLVCNWIKVYGPIDPGTANPLCIVSGLKGRVKDDIEWDANNEIQISNTGDIKYRARLRSSAAYSLASSAMGREYGLTPYDNSENLANDKGAEFSSTHTEFEDKFTINSTDLEGWVTTEDGSQFYYVNNKKLTGIQAVPDPENTGTFYYNFGDDGVCRGKYSGLLKMDGHLYYFVLGERKTGWRFVDDYYYYFDPISCEAVDGVQQIGEFHYTFEDYKLIKGEIVRRGGFLKYAWAGSFYRNGWFILDGNKYCARTSEKLCTGVCRVDPYGGGDKPLLHIFDENAVWHEEINGLYEHTDGETYFADNGILVEYPGLVEVDGDYYYFSSKNTMLKDRANYWISKTNGLLPEGPYSFGPDGKMIRPDTSKEGFYEEEDTIFYYEKGVRTYKGLFELDGNYYYAKTNGEIVHGRSYWITKTNGLLPEKSYNFADDGHIIFDEPPVIDPPDPGEEKNGIVEENGSLWYYENNKLVYKGLFELDGDYYYARTNGEIVHGRSYWITKTNGLLPEKAYTFDDLGRITDLPGTGPIDPPDPGEVKNGIVEENGSLWYYENNQLVYKGLFELDGYYYYARTNGELVHGRSYWITKTNGLLPEKSYDFDDEGKLIEAAPGKEGIVEEDGSLWYYENNVRTYKGLFELDGYYYYAKTNGEIVHGRTYWISKTNGLMMEKAYTFDELGRMVDPPTP